MVHNYLRDLVEYIGVNVTEPEISSFIALKGDILLDYIEFVAGDVKDDNEPVSSTWIYYDSLQEFSEKLRKTNRYSLVQEIMGNASLTDMQKLDRLKEVLK